MKKLLSVFTALVLVGMMMCSCTEINGFSVSVTGMDTVISYKLYGRNARETYTAIDAVFSEIERASDRFVEGSPAERITRDGVSNEKHIIEQVRVSNEVYALSGGAYDITVGAVADIWNVADGEDIPTEDEIDAALQLVDGSLVILKDGAVHIRTGQKLDLGAVAKGYALDAARGVLDKSGCFGAVIAAGGSLLFWGDNPQDRLWRCGVKDPFDNTKRFGVITLDGGCVSTSGSYERFFERDGVKYHHLIDPRTGYPADSGLVSVTVVHDSGALTDALSTACFVLGLDKGTELLKKLGASGIFIDKNGDYTLVGDIDFEREKG